MTLSPQKKTEVRNLLTVVLGGVVTGFLIMGLLLYYYGPAGNYLVKHVLLTPEVLEQLSFSETRSDGVSESFVFDRVELSYWNSDLGVMENYEVDRNAYREFFLSVAEERSVDVYPEVERIFHGQHVATLRLKVRPLPGGDSRIFQMVQISPEQDYFRIQLRMQQDNVWAYFKQSGVSSNSIKYLKAQRANPSTSQK